MVEQQKPTRQEALDFFNKWMDDLAEEDLRNPYFQQTVIENEGESDATEKGKQSENNQSEHPNGD